MKKVIIGIFISIILLILIVTIGQIGLKTLPYIIDRMCTDYKKISESSQEELKDILDIDEEKSFELIYIKHVRTGTRK